MTSPRKSGQGDEQSGPEPCHFCLQVKGLFRGLLGDMKGDTNGAAADERRKSDRRSQQHDIDESHQQSEQDLGQQQESCRSCLYTGVGTCLGLSGYFLYLALEEEEGRQTSKMNRPPRYKVHDNHGLIGKGEPKSKLHESTKMQVKSNAKNSSLGQIIQKQSTQSTPTGFQSSLVNFLQGNPAPKKNRPFLFASSVVWAAAGAYRLYLN